MRVMVVKHMSFSFLSRFFGGFLLFSTYNFSLTFLFSNIFSVHSSPGLCAKEKKEQALFSQNIVV